MIFNTVVNGGSKLAFDETPTAGSTNPVTSEGIKKYVDEATAGTFGPKIAVTVPAGSVVTCTDGTTTMERTSTGDSVLFNVPEYGTWTVTATLNGKSAEEVVEVDRVERYSVAPEFPKIYGATWAGTSATTWTRTDDAATFSDPVPAVGNGAGNSPFDSIMPWAGMVRVTDAEAGELVAIPKFWYRWSKSGTAMALQIADHAEDGFNVSPAHADRGDGAGERDMVYVGRYHCVSNYKSTTGAAQQNYIARATARTNIHNLGSTIWQWDFATHWTIAMLYLVEFADWNSQAKIGYGCGNNISFAKNGQTDAMGYHTGTTAASRTTYGFTQYRNIEGLWDNVFDWMDGCYYSSSGMSVIMNPNNFSDTTNGTVIGTPFPGHTTAFEIPSISGLDWALYPSESFGMGSTYVTDYWDFDSSSPCLYVGGSYDQDQNYGLFCAYCVREEVGFGDVGCRLMKLP